MLDYVNLWQIQSLLPKLRDSRLSQESEYIFTFGDLGSCFLRTKQN